MIRLVSKILGVTVITAVTLFGQNLVSLAHYDPDDLSHFKIYGPQTDPLYFTYGDDDTDPDPFPRSQMNGITITLDEASVSHQAVVATVTMPEQLIAARNITRFAIELNGNRVVDEFYPYWDNWTERDKRYYRITITPGMEYTGARMYFKVVGLADNGSGQEFVVAWSNISETFTYKPFPVVDVDSVGWLSRIYTKLEELRSMLDEKMDDLADSVKKIYEISPETQQKFDNALNNLQSKLPTEIMKNQANQVRDIVENSAAIIENTEQEVEFGEFSWMGVITTPILDFSGMMDHVEGLRKILQITLWLEFFYGVILILRPRLTV